MIYLDNSATTRVLPTAIAAANTYMNESFFNPSSAYGPAVQAERAVNAARERLAAAMGAQAKEIVFTSGGTESNNMAIFNVRRTHRGKGRIITSMVEHASVFEPFRRLEEQGYDVVYLGVNETGSVRLDELENALDENTQLISIMHVNNETGAVNDLAAAYALIQNLAPGAVLHADGVQAFCKLPFGELPCDMYSVSGHKFHGPKGVGALYVRDGVVFEGGQIGGGQERGLRSGTTNSPGILGMDAALRAYRQSQDTWVNSMRACKLRLASNLAQIPDVLVNGPSPEEGAPHVLNVSFLGVGGEVLLRMLSDKGIYVSTGSACSAKKKGKNRILNAMDITGPRQEGAIRFSFCAFNTQKEMDQAAQAIRDAVAFLRKYKRR